MRPLLLHLLHKTVLIDNEIDQEPANNWRGQARDRQALLLNALEFFLMPFTAASRLVRLDGKNHKVEFNRILGRFHPPTSCMIKPDLTYVKSGRKAQLHPEYISLLRF